MVIQLKPSSMNTDGSFTMANSIRFLVPLKILPIAQENKYLEKFSYFIMEMYVVCILKKRLFEAIQMSTFNIPL